MKQRVLGRASAPPKVLYVFGPRVPADMGATPELLISHVWIY